MDGYTLEKDAVTCSFFKLKKLKTRHEKEQTIAKEGTVKGTSHLNNSLIIYSDSFFIFYKNRFSIISDLCSLWKSATEYRNKKGNCNFLSQNSDFSHNSKFTSHNCLFFFVRYKLIIESSTVGKNPTQL